MKQIVLRYDDFYDNWVKIITQCLRYNEVVFNENLPLLLCENVKVDARAFVIKLGYTPKNNVYYRVNLINRLKSQGLDMCIESNDILWKYLEYFTDIDDFSKCFDINLVVINKDKAIKSKVLLNMTDDKYILTQPIHKQSTLDINNKIKELNEQDVININDILDILYLINNKED